MKYVNHPVPKKDAMALVTGKPVYTDDLAPKDCLVVKLLRSPHPNAWVREIRTEAAKKVEGIVCVLTYQDVPDQRFTIAGQTYPELSPYPGCTFTVCRGSGGDCSRRNRSCRGSGSGKDQGKLSG